MGSGTGNMQCWMPDYRQECIDFSIGLRLAPLPLHFRDPNLVCVLPGCPIGPAWNCYFMLPPLRDGATCNSLSSEP